MSQELASVLQSEFVQKPSVTEIKRKGMEAGIASILFLFLLKLFWKNKVRDYV